MAAIDTADGALREALGALAAGDGREDVEAALIRRGLEREAARDTVDEAERALAEEREREEARRRPLAAGFLAGTAVALAAGSLWAWVVVASGDRLTPLAWGIGVLAGAAIVRVGRRRGRRAQLVALACATVGLLLGKYLAFAFSLHDLTDGRVGVLSLEAQRTFTGNLGAAFGFGDLVPWAFALWGAWAMPRVPRPRRPGQSRRLTLAR